MFSVFFFVFFGGVGGGGVRSIRLFNLHTNSQQWLLFVFISGKKHNELEQCQLDLVLLLAFFLSVMFFLCFQGCVSFVKSKLNTFEKITNL